jgi:hypothetical protein
LLVIHVSTRFDVFFAHYATAFRAKHFFKEYRKKHVKEMMRHTFPGAKAAIGKDENAPG